MSISDSPPAKVTSRNTTLCGAPDGIRNDCGRSYGVLPCQMFAILHMCEKVCNYNSDQPSVHAVDGNVCLPGVLFTRHAQCDSSSVISVGGDFRALVIFRELG